MALSKAIPLGNTGVSLTYWRLIGVDVDFITNIATVKLAGYIDAEARNAGRGPGDVKQVRWVGSENPITVERMVAGTAFAAAYTKLTEAQELSMMPNTNPFTGATLI